MTQHKDPSRLVKDISPSFGLVASLLSVLLVSLRLLQITGHDPYTAIFILAHGDKITLLVGLLIPLAPLLCILVGVSLLRVVVFTAKTFISKLGQLSFWSSLGLIALGISAGGWDTLKAGTLSILAVLFMNPFRNLPYFTEKEIEERKDVQALTRFSQYALIATIAIVPFTTSTDQTWLPNECIDDKYSTHFGTVIGSDSQYTYFVDMSQHIPKIFKTSEITGRSLGISAKMCWDVFTPAPLNRP